MTVLRVLDTLPLGTSAPENSRAVIAEGLWNLVRPPYAYRKDDSYEDVLHGGLYFGDSGYYAEQCSLFDYSSSTSIKTHGQILDVANILRKPLPREDLLRTVSALLGPADDIRHSMSVNLVVRLMLMMKVGNLTHEAVGRSLDWKTGTLQSFVHHQFPAAPRRSHERLKLERTFTVFNLHRIAHVEIKWTDNLAAHLQMINDDKIVVVFRHASFLKAQLHR